MSNAEITELEIALKKIKDLESEIDDYQEFVRSANKYLEFETSLKARSHRLSDLNNLRTMCNYLMINRYISRS